MSDQLNDNPLSELFTSLKGYLDLRIDEAKLSTSEHLAKLVSKFLYILVMFFVLSLALGFLCVLLCLWVDKVTGNDMLGPVCIFGVLIVLAGVFYFFRDKLFVNHSVRIFIEMFFGRDKHRDE